MCLVVKGAQVLAEEEERETSFSSHCWALQLIQPRPSHLASELRAALSLSQHPTSLACLLLAWEEARREGDAGQPQDSGDWGYHSVNKPEAMPSSSLSTVSEQARNWYSGRTLSDSIRMWIFIVFS